MMYAVARHLLESTLFAAVALLGAAALRRGRASTRHVLLLGAAFKFALPIALLVWLGARVRGMVPLPLGLISMPTVLPTLLTSPVGNTSHEGGRLLSGMVLGVWIAGAALALFLWLCRLHAGHDLSGEVTVETQMSLERAMTQAGLARAPRLRTSPTDMEPRLIGFWRPMIVLSETLVFRLTPSALDAVLLHELAHARRYDNLSRFIVHTLTCIFWFYPLFAWLERRIDAECELACDDLVLSSGVSQHEYLDGILHVCNACVLEPVPGLSGFSGSNLKQRMEFIMSFHAGRTRSRIAGLTAGMVLPLVSIAAVLAGFSTVMYGRGRVAAEVDAPRSAVSCLFAGVSYPEGVVIKQGAGPQQMCAELDGRPLWIRTSDESRERSRQLVSLPEPAPFVCKPTAPSGKFCTCADDVLFSVGGSARSQQGALLSCATGGKWQTMKKP